MLTTEIKQNEHKPVVERDKFGRGWVVYYITLNTVIQFRYPPNREDLARNLAELLSVTTAVYTDTRPES